MARQDQGYGEDRRYHRDEGAPSDNPPIEYEDRELPHGGNGEPASGARHATGSRHAGWGRTFPGEDRDAYQPRGREPDVYGAPHAQEPARETEKWLGSGAAEDYGTGRSFRTAGRPGVGGYWDGAREEIASWMGSQKSEPRESFRGKGPKGYARSAERILEDINDRLTDDPWLDASEIEVSVEGSEATLKGTVSSRRDRRRAEAIAEDVLGVTYVQNNLRVAPQQESGGASSGSPTGSATV